MGAQILSSTETLAHLAPAVLAEHERWDGDGYPNGLAGEQIPLAARIVFVCDAYDAMTSDRPYRSAMTPDAAIARAAQERGNAVRSDGGRRAVRDARRAGPHAQS